jgi:hypothetical protein
MKKRSKILKRNLECVVNIKIEIESENKNENKKIKCRVQTTESFIHSSSHLVM